MTLEDKIDRLERAGEHIGSAYNILWALGYQDYANTLLELLDEIEADIAILDVELEEQE